MKIIKLWFENGRIYVTNDKEETLYQSLKFYPRLLVATDEQRAKYEFEPFGIHWDDWPSGCFPFTSGIEYLGGCPEDGHSAEFVGKLYKGNENALTGT